MAASASVERLARNDLAGALSALQDQVRADPSDAKLRIYLFQLLGVLGDWSRAVTQLKLSAELDALAVPMAQAYREAIICEVFREKVFRGEKEALVFGKPLEWVALLIEANKALSSGNFAGASQLRDKAFDMVPPQGGTLNGKRFEWISDADMRLGPLLEVVVNGRYFWMPFSVISKLEIEEPVDLRDVIWTPANITLANGGEIVAFIPTRYAGTLENGDDAAKLSRSTTWVDVGDETFTGLGQRIITTDADEIPINEVRTLVMDPVAPRGDAEDG